MPEKATVGIASAEHDPEQSAELRHMIVVTAVALMARVATVSGFGHRHPVTIPPRGITTG